MGRFAGGATSPITHSAPKPPFYLKSKVRVFWIIRFHRIHWLFSRLINHSTVSLNIPLGDSGVFCSPSNHSGVENGGLLMHYAHSRPRKGSGAWTLISKGPIRSNTYATTKYLQKKRLVCVSFLVVQGFRLSNYVYPVRRVWIDYWILVVCLEYFSRWLYNVTLVR